MYPKESSLHTLQLTLYMDSILLYINFFFFGLFSTRFFFFANKRMKKKWISPCFTRHLLFSIYIRTKIVRTVYVCKRLVEVQGFFFSDPYSLSLSSFLFFYSFRSLSLPLCHAPSLFLLLPSHSVFSTLHFSLSDRRNVEKKTRVSHT